MPDLVTRASENTFGQEFLDDILSWISDWFDPDEIFDDAALKGWAEENGWTEEV